MSGIAKPLVKFSNSKTPTVPVNADFIAAIEKIDIPANPNQPASSAEYGILVTYVLPHAAPQKVMWAVKATRDAAFTAFETLVCGTI
jgi:hypothetical protein